MVFSAISFLKPVIIATETIITARLRATAAVAIFTNGLERLLVPFSGLVIRLAMKCSTLKGVGFGE